VRRHAPEWSPEELIESWTLLGQDRTLVGNKSGATRLGSAVLLKFFEIEARFPRGADELPAVGGDHDQARGAVDQHPKADGVARAEQPGRGRGRGDPPLGHPGPARCAQGADFLTVFASEVAAMIEGLLRHCTDTDTDIEANYVDTHGPAWSGSPSPSCSGSGCCRN
jgi:hypothetical protein